jgi:ubiquinone/menaquinone biosynthesis C-methylase UbiE
MSERHNPQAAQMGDESMARNLAHQAEAIWPQEQRLFDRYGLSGAIAILDVGCGTGEITRRLAARYPLARLLGIDILEGNLQRARADASAVAARIDYRQGDAFALDQPAASVDLVVCRHLSQAVPDFPRVLAELTRVLKPGGWLHLLSEDYGMLHMPPGERDPDRFWNQVVIGFLDGIGCDGRIGRRSPALMEALGYRDLAMDYVVVDTLRVPRATFAAILQAWRDGYIGALAESSGRSLADLQAEFAAIINAVQTPPHYAVWQVPVISGRKP